MPGLWAPSGLAARACKCNLQSQVPNPPAAGHAIRTVATPTPPPTRLPTARAPTGSDGEDSDSDNEGGAGGNKRGGAGGAAGAKRRGGKSGAASSRPLSRPIICIANDLYAPQLRPLRDVARVFTFTPPSSERLAARLQQICRAEVGRCAGRCKQQCSRALAGIG